MLCMGQGNHCPNGTAIEVPCSPGHYNPLPGLGGDSCPPCAAGTFQTGYGATSCSPCSASSVSSIGATICTCTGLNRVFQPTDGYCVCAPGFEFVDESFHKLSEEDGVQPCQPIVYDYCVSGQTRGADGTCVTASTCSSCPSGEGKLIARTGLCECSGLPSLEDVCNAACRRTAPVVQVNANGSITITQVDPVTLEVAQATLSITALAGFAGSLQCSSPLALLTSSIGLGGSVGPGGVPLLPSSALQGCRIVTLQASDTGIAGSYDMSAALSSALQSNGSGNTTRRLLNEGLMDSERLSLFHARWRAKFHRGTSAAAFTVSHGNRFLATAVSCTYVCCCP